MKKYNDIYFDLDSTLVKIEGLDYLGNRKGVGEEVKSMTTRAMEGEFSVADAFSQKMALIQPSKSDLEHLAQVYLGNIVEDAREVVELLHKLNKKVSIVTGNFAPAPSIFAENIGIPLKNVYQNTVNFDEDNNYLNFDEANPLLASGGKRSIVKKHAPEAVGTVFIGDAITDLETKEAVELFIGFGGVVKRDIVHKNSDVFVHSPSLAGILPVILNEEEIVQAESLGFKDLIQRANEIQSTGLIEVKV